MTYENEPFIDTRHTAIRMAGRIRRASPRDQAVLARYLAGARQCDIAREFGVSPRRIHQIVWPLRGRNLRFRLVTGARR